MMEPRKHRITIMSTFVEVDDRRLNATQVSIRSRGDFTIEVSPGTFKLTGLISDEPKIIDEGDVVTVISEDIPVNTRMEREDFIVEENVLYGYSRPVVLSINVNKDVTIKLNYKYTYKSPAAKIKIDNSLVYFNAITSPFFSAWLYINEGALYIERDLTTLLITTSSKPERGQVISQREGFQPSLT
ncbi:MAG: hypothetical protein JHC12_02485 [Thermogladius sp.]|jgi:hypothetical protein|nr:hypothetical protein [Thermogladius sp.]